MKLLVVLVDTRDCIKVDDESEAFQSNSSEDSDTMQMDVSS